MTVGGGCWNGPMIEVMRPGTPVEVDGLDADWVLDLARDAELMARQAERAKLRAANRWADLHAATAESGVEVWGNAGALECEVPIGGAGAPTLAAFSVEPLGAALGISTLSAMNLISAAVELKHRLPRVWALRIPLLPDPRPRLRPGPRRPLRRHRTTRPDAPTQPRPAVPATPPRQDRQAMVLPPHRGRVLCLDLTPTRSTTSSRTAAPSPWPTAESRARRRG